MHNDLEWRLREHFDALNEAIEQRDRMAIDAAWGVASGISGTFLAGCVIFAAYKWFPDHWLTWVIAAVAANIAYAGGWMVANNQRMKEVDRFWRLPRWDMNA